MSAASAQSSPPLPRQIGPRGYDGHVRGSQQLLGIGVALFLLAPARASAAPPAVEIARLAPDLTTLAASPAVLAHLADERGKVSVLVDLAAEGVDAEQLFGLGVRRVAPGVGARTLSPDEVPAFFASSAGARPWISPPLRLMLDRSAKLWTRTAIAHDTGHRGKGVLVGVVDTGLDVAHDDLRDPVTGATRVAWLLDYARKPLGKHAALEADFGCTGDSGPCAVLAREDIDEELSAKGRSRDLVGHGTHVASLAAGNGGAKKRFVGGAPEADLVIARITRGSGETLSEADLLDAVRFMFDRGDAMKRPIVTNVSLGGDFGPHDGTSLLERGLAAFVGPDKPGHAMVAAAGNSGSICVRGGESYGVHTETRVLPDSVTRVALRSPVSEGAIRGGSFVWINLQPGDDVHIGVEWNGRTMIVPRAPGTSSAIEGNQAEGYPYMAVINGVVGGTSPIQRGSYGAVVVFDGAWQSTDRFDIRLEGHGLAQVWVQGTGEASTDGACSGLALAGAIKQGTVSVPATHPALLAVGCTLNRTDWPTTDGVVGIDKLGGVDKPTLDSSCYFSGAGPSATGVPKPEISAPGAFVVGAMSGDATPATSTTSMFRAPKGTCDGHSCYVVDTDHGVATGTSMSAPQVTGAVALLLEADPTLTQPEIVALLQGGARPFAGDVPFDFQVGPGALDAVGALAALTERGAPRNLVPTGENSWLTLSVGFARPDASLPFTGTLLLRAADGGIADGFDEGPLGLEVENGAVQLPLTRQAPGVWSFAVAANGRAGGETLTLRARYGETVLATRSLPIAADANSLTTFPRAAGGCALALASTEAPGAHAALGVGLAGLLLLTSRRSSAARTRCRRGRCTAPHRS